MQWQVPQWTAFEADNWQRCCRLEALPVDDGRARLVVLLLADPHLLERGQRREDRAADPDRVLALGRSDDLDLHRGRSQRRDLLLHAVGDAREHGGAARQHGVGVQVLADVDVALHDRVVGGLVDAARLHAEERRLEHGLRAAEALVADGDDLSVGELVALLERRGRGRRRHLLLEVERDVAELLLDVADDLTLGRRREAVAALRQDLQPTSQSAYSGPDLSVWTPEWYGAGVVCLEQGADNSMIYI